MMLSQIIKNDWKNLTAERSVLVIGIAFALLVGFAIYSGVKWTKSQDRLMAQPQPISGQTDQSDPYLVGSKLTYAELPSGPLAFTAIGQSDVLRPKIGVSILSKQRTEADKQGFENPLSFLAGRFDLAFVIVFLLPLLILAVSFNLISAERENGTLQMVLSQPVSLASFALTKIFHRAVLVSVLICGVGVFGVLLSGSSRSGGSFLGRLLLWLIAVSVYGLFWFALALFVNSFGRASATNAVVLAGCWIVLVLVLPSLVNVAVATIYPMPSRIDEINAIRSVNLDMRRDGSRLVSEFYQDHPELAPVNNVSEKALTLAYVTIQQELKRRLGEVEDKFNAQLEQQQGVVNHAQFVSPAIVMQETLNLIAATDVARHQLFRAQAKTYAESWDATFLPLIYRNVKLTAADYDRIPRFTFVEQSFASILKNVMVALLGILVPTGTLLSLSIMRLKKAKLAN